MLYQTPALSPDYRSVVKAHFGGANYALSHLGFSGTISLYAGLLTLLANLAVVVVATVVLRLVRVPAGVDLTRAGTTTPTPTTRRWTGWTICWTGCRPRPGPMRYGDRLPNSLLIGNTVGMNGPSIVHEAFPLIGSGETALRGRAHEREAIGALLAGGGGRAGRRVVATGRHRSRARQRCWPRRPTAATPTVRRSVHQRYRGGVGAGVRRTAPVAASVGAASRRAGRGGPVGAGAGEGRLRSGRTVRALRRCAACLATGPARGPCCAVSTMRSGWTGRRWTCWPSPPGGCTGPDRDAVRQPAVTGPDGRRAVARVAAACGWRGARPATSQRDLWPTWCRTGCPATWPACWPPWPAATRGPWSTWPARSPRSSAAARRRRRGRCRPDSSLRREYAVAAVGSCRPTPGGWCCSPRPTTSSTSGDLMRAGRASGHRHRRARAGRAGQPGPGRRHQRGRLPAAVAAHDRVRRRDPGPAPARRTCCWPRSSTRSRSRCATSLHLAAVADGPDAAAGRPRSTGPRPRRAPPRGAASRALERAADADQPTRSWRPPTWSPRPGTRGRAASRTGPGCCCAGSGRPRYRSTSTPSPSCCWARSSCAPARQSHARQTLLAAAGDLGQDRHLALSAMMRAGEALCLSGDYPRLADVARQALALRRSEEPLGTQLLFEQFAGLTAMFQGNYDTGAGGPLRRVLALADELRRRGRADPGQHGRASCSATTTRPTGSRYRAVSVARSTGDATSVPQALELAGRGRDRRWVATRRPGDAARGAAAGPGHRAGERWPATCWPRSR